MKELAHSSSASKRQPTQGPLYRDLFLFVATPCLPQRAMSSTCTPMQRFPVMPSNSGSLVNQLRPLLHTWPCAGRWRVGQERKGVVWARCLPSRAHVAAGESMCSQVQVQAARDREKPQFSPTRPGCLFKIPAPCCP